MNNKQKNLMNKNFIDQQNLKNQVIKQQNENKKEYEENVINDFNELKTFIKKYRHEVLKEGKILNYTSIGVGIVNIILYFTTLFI